MAQTMKDTKNIAVLSGKGGVGKTTVSVGIAKALNAGLFDVDVMAPNVPEILDGGIQRKMCATDRGIIPALQDGLEVVSLYYDMPEDTVFMQGQDFVFEILRSYINHVQWESGWVVVDTPPGTGTESRTVLALLPNIKSIVVTTRAPVSVVDCRRTVNMLKTAKKEIIGIIENMAGYVDDKGRTKPMFKGKDLEKEFGDVPLLGQVPFFPNDPAKQYAEIANIVNKHIKRE